LTYKDILSLFLQNSSSVLPDVSLEEIDLILCYSRSREMCLVISNTLEGGVYSANIYIQAKRNV